MRTFTKKSCGRALSWAKRGGSSPASRRLAILHVGQGEHDRALLLQCTLLEMNGDHWVEILDRQIEAHLVALWLQGYRGLGRSGWITQVRTLLVTRESDRVRPVRVWDRTR